MGVVVFQLNFKYSPEKSLGFGGVNTIWLRSWAMGLMWPESCGLPAPGVEHWLGSQNKLNENPGFTTSTL